jgi:hypothetical protein
MKRILLAIALIMSASLCFAATTGNGTCTVGAAEAIAGQKIASIAFTYTVATNNMVAGNVHVKWPSGYGVPTLARVALTGDATEAKKVVIWSDNGQYYVGCTATADVAQTIIFTFSNMTVTATAGSQTFTWASADSALTTYSAVAIASQPLIYAWSANKAAAVGTVGPSPVALNSDTTNFSAQMVWSVSPVYGAQIRWQMSQGTPGFQNTPNPLTFAASTTNTKNNASWIKATPGSFDTPVCNATECYANILAAATISIGDVFEIRFGPPTVAATVTPWHGSNYAKNMKINIKVNAANPATTETPVTYPTESVSGNFLFTVATPTIAITPVYTDKDIWLVVNGKNKASHLIQSSGGTYSKSDQYVTGTRAYPFDASDYGAYSVTALMRWQDVDNDGVYRTVTSSALVLYKLSNLSLNEMEARGLISTDKFTGMVDAGADVLGTTLFVDARAIVRCDITGQSNTAYELAQVVAGSNVTNTVIAHEGAEVGQMRDCFILPAARRVNITAVSAQSASDEEAILKTHSLPTR